METFDPQRLLILNQYNSNISQLYKIKSDLEIKHKKIIDDAIASVSDQIWNIIKLKTSVDKAILDLTEMEDDYRKQTCGHLEYDDKQGVHMCLWCGKDL